MRADDLLTGLGLDAEARAVVREQATSAGVSVETAAVYVTVGVPPEDLARPLRAAREFSRASGLPITDAVATIARCVAAGDLR